MNDNRANELPPITEIGFRKLKSLLKGTLSGQALLNAYALGQQEREIRVRSNLDRLESVQKAAKDQPSPD